MTLEAANRPGKRALVVLTDGIDNCSRRGVKEVIERAKQTHTPLHMLGLGRDNEIDAKVMRSMGRGTGGSFYHVKGDNELVRVFETLSIDLHDDGIDETALKELAGKTGGKYVLARDVSKLQFHFREIADELQSTFTVSFVSPRQVNDGTARPVEVSIWRNGVRISDVASKGYAVRGVIIPEMEAGIYLMLLGVLAAVLLVPSGIRALYRFYGGT
jgi:hypothetical protein